MASLAPCEQRRVHETGSCSLTKSGVGHYELAAMFGNPHERERDCLHESRKQNDSQAHTENELTTYDALSLGLFIIAKTCKSLERTHVRLQQEHFY